MEAEQFDKLLAISAERIEELKTMHCEQIEHLEEQHAKEIEVKRQISQYRENLLPNSKTKSGSGLCTASW